MNALETVIHKHPDSIRELAGVWKRLMAQDPDATVFQHYEWMAVWWEKNRQSHTPFVVEVRAGGATVCLFPLCLSPKNVGPLKLNTLRFMGYGTSDYLVPLLAAGNDATATFDAAFAALMREKSLWDRLEFSDLPEASALQRYLKTNNGVPGCQALMIAADGNCPYLPIEPEWEAMQAKFERALLKDMLYQTRRLARTGGEFVNVCDKEKIAPMMDELFALHRKRWGRTDTPSLFEDKRERQYFLQLAYALWDLDLLVLSAVHVDDRAISMMFGMKDSRKMYCHTIAFDPDYLRYSPGKLICYKNMQACHEQGYEQFDMMRGGYDHKICWGATMAYNAKWLLFNDSVKSRLIKMIHGIRRRLTSHTA